MTIVSRADWAAKPASLPTAKMSLPATALWVHHTVTKPSADPARDMRTVEAIGLQRFGYFSYSFCVHPSGAVLEGAGLRRGAHTAQQNSTSFGVAFIGNYEVLDPTAEQMESARWLIWWLQEEGHLRPEIYPTGGHRDAPGASTACPGARLYGRLDDLRAPWFPSAPERTETVPIHVHDYEEAATKTTMVHCGPLDGNGAGWTDWQPGLGRDPIIVGVTLRGPSPPDDGYWDNQKNVTLAAQPRGGAVRVVVRGGTPGDTVTAFVTVA
jgi:hypothetical protein